MLGKEITNLVIVKMEEYSPFGPSSSATLLAGGDQIDEVKPVYSYIKQHLAEAANEMLMIAPIHKLLYKKAEMGAVVNNNDEQTGTIPLPIDFLRIHTLRMEEWTRPLHTIIHEGHPDYPVQFCRWTRGTCQKPVAIYNGDGLTMPLSEVDVTIISEKEFQNEYTKWVDECQKKKQWADRYWQTYPNGTIHKAYYDEADKQEKTIEYAPAKLQYFSVPANSKHIISTFYYIPKFSEKNDYDRSIAELIALHCARKVYEVYGNAEQVSMITNEINSVLENLRQ